jgi:hypothetical protein
MSADKTEGQALLRLSGYEGQALLRPSGYEGQARKNGADAPPYAIRFLAYGLVITTDFSNLTPAGSFLYSIALPSGQAEWPKQVKPGRWLPDRFD